MEIKKKSQAAMEFMMTYGWAVLIVLVAIGALAYFGVLSPDKFLPSRCTLPAGIACVDHDVTDPFGVGVGEVHVVIKNSLGYNMELVSIAASGCTGGTTESLIRNGADPVLLTANGCAVTSGKKYSGDINITYTNADSRLVHVAKGTLSARVRSGEV